MTLCKAFLLKIENGLWRWIKNVIIFLGKVEFLKEVAMKKLLLSLVMILFLWSVIAHAELKTSVIEYKHGDTALEGYLANDDAIPGKRPGVIVVHEWWGLNPYTRMRTEQLARKIIELVRED
jgi:hypothetical protein